MGGNDQVISMKKKETNRICIIYCFRILPDKLIASIMSVLETIGANDKLTKAKVEFSVD